MGANQWDSNGIFRTTQDVALQDQTTQPIHLTFNKLTQALTLVGTVAIDDTSITVTSDVEPTDGETVCIKKDDRFYQGHIVSHSANGDDWDLVLDTPLDYNYSSPDYVKQSSTNMAVDGSSASQTFIISPKNLASTVQWDATMISIVITDGAEMDDAKFGGISALTKGVVLRQVDGYTKNIFNAKSNQDLKLVFHNFIYSDKAPAGTYGLEGHMKFGGQSNFGVVIRLSASTDDELQIIIQDDLSDLTTFYAMVHGHVVD
jgi:hypothetical protein